MPKAKVSVVVPCYTGLPYLKETLQSVLLQTYKDWELIYVDDCSKDASLEVAEEFARQDDRIKIVKNPQNLGMVGNWNRACELATGDYVKLLCADDTIEPDCLKEQVKLLDSHPEASLVTSASSVINAQGDGLITRFALGVKPGQGVKEFSAAQVLAMSYKASGNVMGEPSVVMFRKTIMDKVGSFLSEFRYGTDLEYYLRLLVDGRSKIVVSDRNLAKFRLHPGSLTNQGLARGEEELRKIFQVYSKKITNVPFDEARFCRKYQTQVKLKNKIIAVAEKRWGIRLLQTVNLLRMALPSA